MHNLISYNNLKAWPSYEETKETDQITEYFECITDCAIDDKSCISECRLVLDQKTEQKSRGNIIPFFHASWLNSIVRRKGTQFTLAFKGEP